MAVQKVKSKRFEYEFGGPIGAFFIIFGLPAVIYGLFFLCNKDFCLQFNRSPNWDLFFSKVSNYSNFFSDEGFAIFLGWMIFHFLLERVLPGETAYGILLENSKRLPYVLSGHLQFWVTLFVVWHGLPEIVCKARSALFRTHPGADISHGPTNFLPAVEAFNSLPIDLAYDHYLSLISASVLFSLALSIYL
jgi:hypothetical protein